MEEILPGWADYPAVLMKGAQHEQMAKANLRRRGIIQWALHSHRNHRKQDVSQHETDGSGEEVRPGMQRREDKTDTYCEKGQENDE